MSTPAVVNTQTLWWDNSTSQGTNERTDATVAPRPNSTSNEGKAQQSSVPNDVNSDRYPKIPLRALAFRAPSTVAIPCSCDRTEVNGVRLLPFWCFGDFAIYLNSLSVQPCQVGGFGLRVFGNEVKQLV